MGSWLPEETQIFVAFSIVIAWHMQKSSCTKFNAPEMHTKIEFCPLQRKTPLSWSLHFINHKS